MSDSNQTKNQTSQHSKTRQRLKKGHICCLIIFNILLITTNVLALAFAHICQCNVEFDYYGAIIGILSLLVMVLVTWNIYTIIDIKGTIKQIDKMKIDIEVLRKTKENKKATSIKNPDGHPGDSSGDS